MTLMNFFTRRPSAPVARERLQILLTHERSVGGGTDLIALLREEVLAAVAKHISVDPDKVDVKLDSGTSVSMLEIDIELPAPSAGGERRKAEASAI